MRHILPVLGVLLTPVWISAQSLLWEVSGNGLKESSYLYGTMHVQDGRVFDFKPEFHEAFKQAQILCLELDLENVNYTELMQGLVLPEGVSISSLLSEHDYKLVEDFFRDSLGQPLKLYDKMMPFFVATLISMKGMNKDQEHALDVYLSKEGKANGKKIVGLETMNEQVTAFKSIPYDVQAEGLLEAVKYFETEGTEEVDKLMGFYLQGQLDSLYTIAAQSDDYSPEIQAIFQEIFLVKRNRNMVERSEAYMHESSSFIAVGAAHLGGEEGIIALLRQKGYTVSPK